jgi:hypothetical protein
VNLLASARRACDYWSSISALASVALLLDLKGSSAGPTYILSDN